MIAVMSSPRSAQIQHIHRPEPTETGVCWYVRRLQCVHQAVRDLCERTHVRGVCVDSRLHSVFGNEAVWRVPLFIV